MSLNFGTNITNLSRMLRRVTFIGDSSVLIVLSSPNWISYWKCKFIRWQFDFNQGTL